MACFSSLIKKRWGSRLNKNVRVGVGVIVMKDNKVLLGKRIGSHGQNTWSFPGGHLEMYENLEECGKREVEEETGLKIENIKVATFTNDIFEMEEKHYITIFLLSDYKEGEEKVLEPEKCLEWRWYEWSDLPKPLFLPIENLIKMGFSPFGG